MTKTKPETYHSFVALGEAQKAEEAAELAKVKEVERKEAEVLFQKELEAALGEAEMSVIAKVDELQVTESIAEAQNCIHNRETNIALEQQVVTLKRIKGKVVSELASRPGIYMDVLAEIKTLRETANSNYTAVGAKIYQAPPGSELLDRIEELERMKKQLVTAALASVQEKIDVLLEGGGKDAVAFVAAEQAQWNTYKAKAKRSNT